MNDALGHRPHQLGLGLHEGLASYGLVACGDGALRLREIQKAGGKRLSVEHFLAGTPVAAGAVFELPS